MDGCGYGHEASGTMNRSMGMGCDCRTYWKGVLRSSSRNDFQTVDVEAAVERSSVEEAIHADETVARCVDEKTLCT